MYTKRLNTPRTWYKHNAKKYIISLNPGKPSELSIPIGLILKQILDEKTTQIRKIIRVDILVNNKKIKSINYPVMLLDIVSYKDKKYVLTMKNKRLVLDETDSTHLFLRIDKFKKYSKEEYQLNLNNGFNLLTKEKPISKFLKYNIENKQFELLIPTINDKFIVTKGKYLGDILVCKSTEPFVLQYKDEIRNLQLNQIIKIE